MTKVSSATGIVSLLDEDDHELKEMALQRMENLNMVDEYWAEISESLQKIENLFDDDTFKNRELVSLVLSKIYYHLGALDESLQFALSAGKLFNTKSTDEFVNTIITKAIDKYILLREKNEKIEKTLEEVVDKMFERCFTDGEYKQALGLSIESRRIDKLEECIIKSGKVSEMSKYCFDLVQKTVQNREFRHEVLKSIVKLFESLEKPDYFGCSEALLFLEGKYILLYNILDGESLTKILLKLVKSKETKDNLIAYQIGFDLFERSTLYVLTEILKSLKQIENSDENYSKVEKLINILQGDISIPLYVDFLYRRNHSDLSILKEIKESFERNSILHSATITSNSFMHAGTTIDTFLRNNLEWLGQASNWAKFSATASLGVIHKGQIKDSFNILKTYLPSDERRQGSSVYSEGGSLFALGLIHQNNGEKSKDFLLKIVQNEATDEVVQHGACLGLGLSALGSGDELVYESLKEILYHDSAVSGEAAAISMGLTMIGRTKEDSTPIEEMLSYAHETAHEKIIRGLAMGMAITQYGVEESADELISKLVSDKDPILRYGGMFMIGLAYAGTGNSLAIRKLLYIAVSDVSDDVRRAAVTNLGFLLISNPKQCPKLVNLLAESYNPHVRYGAALAIGISCAGTGLDEAIEILEPLAKDRVDFVRQGALISLSMVLIQLPESHEKVLQVRKLIEKSWTGRQEVMSKMGGILANGIIDAGGRNVTIGLMKNGHNRMNGIIGMALFTQYWFWYPYLHYLSLTFDPTCVIGLNQDLKMPEYQFKSNAKPSLFSYPPNKKEPEKKQVVLAPTAQLSTSQKEKAKEQKKKKKTEGMEIESESPSLTSPREILTPFSDTPSPFSLKKKEIILEEEEKKQEKEPEKIVQKEPEFEILQNPSRIIPSQLKYLSFDVDSKYIPLKEQMGLIILFNSKPNEQETLVEMKSYSNEDEKEPDMPEAFNFP